MLKARHKRLVKSKLLIWYGHFKVTCNGVHASDNFILFFQSTNLVTHAWQEDEMFYEGFYRVCHFVELPWSVLRKRNICKQVKGKSVPDRRYQNGFCSIKQLGAYKSLSGTIHPTPEEFEKGSFTLKMHHKFSVRTTSGEFKNATITCHFVWRKLTHRNHMILVTPSFLKSPVFKMFPSTRKCNAGVFKFLQLKKRFRRAPFSWESGVDGRPNRRNKALF